MRIDLLTFLDTNIFLYSFDQSAPEKAQVATRLIREGLVTGQGVVSHQVVEEFFSVALKRFTPPMTRNEAERYLRTVFSPMLGVHSSQELYAEAMGLHSRHRLSWHDAMIVSAAMEAECTLLLSEAMHHGRKFGGMRVENPFLELHRADKS